MFELTVEAAEMLKDYMAHSNVESAIRIAIMHGGCSGSTLGLAFDEEKSEDKIFNDNDLTFIIDKELLNTCGWVKVDYISGTARPGFSLTSEKPVSAGNSEGGGCTGACASGECG